LQPRLIVSRAIEHYFPQPALEALIVQSGRLLKPGEQYFSQLSSGDHTMLRGFEGVLNAVAGKTMRYFTPEEYMHGFIEGIRGADNKPLFTSQLVGHADDQPRNSVQLAMRYLNRDFLNNHEARLHAGGYDKASAILQVQAIAATEDRLSTAVAEKRLKKDDAVGQLEQTIREQPVFALFNQVAVEAAEQQLWVSGVAQTENLRIEQDGDRKDVWINVKYPVIQLTRTDSPIGI
jgi:hypothetical protein